MQRAIDIGITLHRSTPIGRNAKKAFTPAKFTRNTYRGARDISVQLQTAIKPDIASTHRLKNTNTRNPSRTKWGEAPLPPAHCD